ncbi:MAG TPA: hypothetical protein VIG47_16570, partial [Gemmatimonadaceae bacterium]
MYVNLRAECCTDEEPGARTDSGADVSVCHLSNKMQQKLLFFDQTIPKGRTIRPELMQQVAESTKVVNTT